MEFPDLDKSYRSLFDLLDALTDYGTIEGVPQFYFDRKLLREGYIPKLNKRQFLDFQGFKLRFEPYILQLEGKTTWATEEEAREAFYNPKYLTIRTLQNFQTWETEKLENEKRERKEMHDYLNPKEVSLTVKEKALLLFLKGEKPDVSRGHLYNDFNLFQSDENRLHGSPRFMGEQIRRYRKVIGLIPEGLRKEEAKKELRDLESEYYDLTGKKV